MPTDTDYAFGAIKLSRAEQCALRELLDPQQAGDLLDDRWGKRASFLTDSGLTSKSERIEFVHKLKSLLGEPDEPSGSSSPGL